MNYRGIVENVFARSVVISKRIIVLTALKRVLIAKTCSVRHTVRLIQMMMNERVYDYEHNDKV